MASPPPALPPPIPQYYDHSAGPPLPPPKPNSQDVSRSGTPYAQNQYHPPAIPQAPAPPAGLSVPGLLLDKSREDLLQVLNSPELLDALYLSQHPSVPLNSAALNAALQSNANHATRIMALAQNLEPNRSHTSSTLMKTRALERSWREKENEMDAALTPFSARALHARLGQAVGEADAVSKALEESFLEDDGLDADASGDYAGDGGSRRTKAGKDVDNFVKSYRGVRALYHLRKERKERWDENRVGGWR